MNISDLSPAAQLAALKDSWAKMSDADLFDTIRTISEDFAKGSPNGEAFHFVYILQQLGVTFPRPIQFKCSCGKTISAKG